MTLASHSTIVNTKSTIAVTLTTGAAIFLSFAAASYWYRKQRSKWQELEDEEYGQDALPSIIRHFRSLALDENTVVEEANKRRTVGYYENARMAHLQSLVMGVGSYKRLVSKRKAEVIRMMQYHIQGTKSHRTVICMCDATTCSLLKEARDKILDPLQYSNDILYPGVWIPDLCIIPQEDMHVTVAIPWWWHTMGPNNLELSKSLAARFRQALVVDFHHAFQIELERIVLLGGKTLVALWRCVGERQDEDGFTIYDRHGESVDPMLRLRLEIVRCFTTDAPEHRREPLTYTHRKESVEADFGNPTTPLSKLDLPELPAQGGLKRQHSIELKTPGLGSGDGFIHTTLCRLPLDCLSQTDVELEQIHRLCREATATYCGHRMVVSKFRFLETTGAGGDSNPCVDPIYDETVEAPSRLEVRDNGMLVVSATDNLHVPQQTAERSATIGNLPAVPSHKSMTGLFDVVVSDEEDDEAEEEEDDE